MTTANQLNLTEIKTLCTNALINNDWQSLYDAAQKFDLTEVPVIARYYQVYALYQLAGKKLTPEISHRVHELLDIIYARPSDQKEILARPSVQEKVIGFLIDLLAQEAYAKQDFKRAYLYYLYIVKNFEELNYEGYAQALSFVILLLVQFDRAEWAYQRLYYADPKYLVPSLLDTIRDSQGYKKFVAEAEIFMQENSVSAEVLKKPKTENTLEPKQAIAYRMMTPVEAFANTEIDYSYPYQLQNIPCVLLIEQDIEWQGSFDTNEITNYLGCKSDEIPYIILIKGNLSCTENLVCKPKKDLTLAGVVIAKEKRQFLVYGDVTCKVFDSRQQVSIRGVLTSAFTVFQAENASLQVTLLDTPYFYLGNPSNYFLEVSFKNKDVNKVQDFYWNTSDYLLSRHFSQSVVWISPKDWNSAFVEETFKKSMDEVTALYEKLNRAYHIHLMCFKPDGEPHSINKTKFFSAIYHGYPLTRKQLDAFQLKN